MYVTDGRKFPPHAKHALRLTELETNTMMNDAEDVIFFALKARITTRV